MTTKGEGITLTHPLDLKQFGQGVNEKLTWPHLGWFKGSMKQSKACEKSLKLSQYEVRLSPKPTPKGKGDNTRVEHKKGGHLWRQNNMANPKDEANMKVSTFDMSQNVAWTVKAKAMGARSISNQWKMQRRNHARQRLHLKHKNAKAQTSFKILNFKIK
jgi:hypothetical protein